MLALLHVVQPHAVVHVVPGELLTHLARMSIGQRRDERGAIAVLAVDLQCRVVMRAQAAVVRVGGRSVAAEAVGALARRRARNLSGDLVEVWRFVAE